MTVRRKIDARACSVAVLDEAVADDFIDLHHRQGSVRVKKKSIGLYHEDELVSVVQFCYPRTSVMASRYSRELLRLCTKKDVVVRGGASKLVAHYRKLCKPADFFTYQDTTGEVTPVYEHCGMTLVKENKKKQYLVAPGKTLSSGARKDVLGMAYATRYGPDRILGTKLGEVFDADDRRKSNERLFLEELGWHVEVTTGDRVYEWVDPHRTYYVYKITAQDSEKYYYGVSHVKKANATFQDCEQDGYWGSGGSAQKINKFASWKIKHAEKLVKEVIETFSLQSSAYKREEDLVGDLWKTDPLCLNSCRGGKDGGIGRDFATVITQRECSFHGMTHHMGLRCMKCYRAEAVQKECPLHGLTKHLGSKCCKCTTAKVFTVKTCIRHGETKFRGKNCVKCANGKMVTEKECPLHGVTKHQGATCNKCVGEKAVIETVCVTHGVAKFQGGKCTKCTSEKIVTVEECRLHGLVKHQKGKCSKCTAGSGYYTSTCEVHGETKFKGGVCNKCRGLSRIKYTDCTVHGRSKMLGEKCAKCKRAERLTTT